MKNIFRKIVFSLSVLPALTLAASAQQVFNGALSPRLVSPPALSSGGGGVCKFTLSQAETSISANCQFRTTTGFPTDIWVHTNSPVGQFVPSPIYNAALPIDSTSTSFTIPNLTSQDVARLRANRWYVVIESSGYPTGELGAQLHVANGTYNDYDGDGRADLVVYRISALTYFARPSTGGPAPRGILNRSGNRAIPFRSTSILTATPSLIFPPRATIPKYCGE